MATIKERLTSLEVKVKIMIGLLSSQLLYDVVPDAWPPLLHFFASI